MIVRVIPPTEMEAPAQVIPVVLLFAGSGEAMEVDLRDGSSVASFMDGADVCQQFRQHLRKQCHIYPDMLTLFLEPGDSGDLVELVGTTVFKIGAGGGVERDPEGGSAMVCWIDPDPARGDTLRVFWKRDRHHTDAELKIELDRVIKADASSEIFSNNVGEDPDQKLVHFLFRELTIRGRGKEDEPADASDAARLATLFIMLKLFLVAQERKEFPSGLDLRFVEISELLPSRRRGFSRNWTGGGIFRSSWELAEAADLLGVLQFTKRALKRPDLLSSSIIDPGPDAESDPFDSDGDSTIGDGDDVFYLTLFRLLCVAESIRVSETILAIPLGVLDVPRHLFYRWLESEELHGSVWNVILNIILFDGEQRRVFVVPHLNSSMSDFLEDFMGRVVSAAAVHNSERKKMGKKSFVEGGASLDQTGVENSALINLNNPTLGGATLPHNPLSSIAKRIVRMWEENRKREHRLRMSDEEHQELLEQDAARGIVRFRTPPEPDSVANLENVLDIFLKVR